MKLNEQIGNWIKEVEKTRYPEDKEAYEKICKYIADLKIEAKSLYDIIEILKRIDNVQYMMHCYLPKKGYYDTYGSRSTQDNERSYVNLKREKKRLLSEMYKLKSSLEALKE